jgi:hypothetical protein
MNRMVATVGRMSAVVTAIIVGYCLAFGPACWCCSVKIVDSYCVWKLFRPMTRLQYYGPQWASNIIDDYARLWAGKNATKTFMFFENLNE